MILNSGPTGSVLHSSCSSNHQRDVDRAPGSSHVNYIKFRFAAISCSVSGEEEHTPQEVYVSFTVQSSEHWMGPSQQVYGYLMPQSPFQCIRQPQQPQRSCLQVARGGRSLAAVVRGAVVAEE